MEELIGLIIQALVELFSGGRNTPKPGAKPPPQRLAQPPIAPPTARQTVRRPIPTRKPQPPRRPGRMMIKPLPAAAPVPRPVILPASAVRPPASPPPPPASPPIRATAVRQLIRSRPASLRTICVLSEIIQPPLALREI